MAGRFFTRVTGDAHISLIYSSKSDGQAQRWQGGHPIGTWMWIAQQSASSPEVHHHSHGKEADTSGAGARQPGEEVSRKRSPGTNSPYKGHKTQAVVATEMDTCAHRFMLPLPQFGTVTGRWLPQTGLHFPEPLASWDHMMMCHLTARDLPLLFPSLAGRKDSEKQMNEPQDGRSLGHKITTTGVTVNFQPKTPVFDWYMSNKENSYVLGHIHLCYNN